MAVCSKELHRFQEESYLKEHNQVYLYLPDNRELVYTVTKCGYVKADSDTFWLGEPSGKRHSFYCLPDGADSSKNGWWYGVNCRRRKRKKQ